MGIIKKIFYFLRLFFAISIFILMIIVSIAYFKGNNIFNISFENIQNYIMKNPALFTLKAFGLLAIITFVFGRIWCSLICPVGTFQEIIWLISRRENEKRPSYFYKYILLAAIASIVYFFHSDIIKYIVNHTAGFIWICVTCVLLIGVLTIFKGRFFCTDICPFGALYGLIAKLSIFRIHTGKECMCCTMCESVCPSGCIDVCDEHVNNVTCVKCFRCFAACSENGMKYGIKIR